MSKVARKQHTAEFKAKVALEAIRGELTLAELAAKHGIDQTMIATWKKQAVEGMATTFSGKTEAMQATSAAELTKPHVKMCQWWSSAIFVEGLRSMGVDRKRMVMDPAHPHLSIVRQCGLVSISRWAFYYEPTDETPLNLVPMRLIDELFLEIPFYGVRQMARYLRRQSDVVGPKRTSRPMAKMPDADAHKLAPRAGC